MGSMAAVMAAGIAVYTAYRIKDKKEADNIEKQCNKEDIKIVNTASDVLMNKIGAKLSDIQEAKMFNKTAYEIAEDKGFSKEQLKMFINQDRTRDIDELELNRKITKEVAHQVKEKIIEHTDKWDGMLN